MATNPLDALLTPQGPADPAVDAVRKRIRETAAARLLSSEVPPDVAAQAKKYADATGLPLDTVARNLQSFKQQADIQNAADAMDRHPGLAAWASDPRNAAVGADDMEHLAKNAAAFGQLGRHDAIGPVAPPAPTFLNGIAGIATSLYEGFKSLSDVVVQPFMDFGPDLTPRRAGIPSLDSSTKGVQRRIAQSNARVDAATPAYQSFIGRSLYTGASSLAQALPAVGVGILTGQPEVGLAVAGLQQGLPAYSKYRARGASPKMALLGGTAEGAIEVATEKLPLGFIVNKLGKTGAGHFLSGYLGRELPSELAATLGQNAVDTAIANPDKTWGQFLAEQPDQLGQTAIATLISGGFFTGVNHASRVFAERDAARSQAVELAGLINDAMDAAAESKTRARDPQAFADLVALHTEGTSAENLFIPAEKVAAYFQSQDADYHSDDFWRDYAGQIEEGLATGGDVVVPTAQAAAHLTGTPAWDALKADTRVSPGGPSLAESEALKADHEAAMMKLGEAAAGIDTGPDESGRQAIYQDIRDKLTNAGYTQDAAHTNAELIAARYATRAARLGETLKGDETAKIVINQVLPDNLAPVVAASPGDVGLKSVINVLRGAVPKDNRESLADWIKAQGGIEDPGGDLAAMGFAPFKGVARKGEIKIIRKGATAGQASFIGTDGQQNTNTPDELALRAQEAGFFPPGDRPTVNDLLDALGREARGEKVYRVDAVGPERIQAAADELGSILSQADLDPATATDDEIKAAVAAYQAAQDGGYQQSFGAGRRGQISFVDGKSIIDLFASRNTSTFLHESGHQWLEELRADATRDDAPQQLRDDWRSVKDWFAANGHVATDDFIPVDAHEMFARGVERFLLEGKSPSTVLRKIFDTFRAWLLHVYQVVDNLRSPITPEVRDVMSRLIATDDEIATATEREQIKALFTDAAAAGMSDQEFAAYQKVAIDARDEAHDALLYKTMASIRAARTRAWKDEEAAVRAEMAESVSRRPVFRALQLIRTGRLASGEPQVSARISQEWLVQNYGEGVLALLPRGVPPIYTDKATMHADDIAALTGFRSGDEMVRTLITLEQHQRDLRAGGDKRSVRQVLIDEATAHEMATRHGDPLNDGSIEQDALVAVHNEKQGEVIAAELRSLSRRANKQPTPYSLAKEWARTKIAGSTVQEAISGQAIQRYVRAASKAGKLAEDAMLRRDAAEAYKQKQAQMLNNALIAEAGQAREAMDAARNRLAGYARRKTIKSIDQDYLDQIHALLEQVDLKPRSQTSIDRQQSFEEWAQARQAEGHDVIVPQSFAATLGQTHWTRLTVDQMRGLDEAVKQIAALGRFKQELLDGAEKRDREAVINEALGQIDQLPPKPPKDLLDPGFADRIKSGISSIDASLLKLETVFDWLDNGNSQGVFNRIVFKPIADAQTREQDMTADYLARIRRHMEEIPGETLTRWNDAVVLPELIDPATGEPVRLNRQKMIAMALNMGNEGNIQRLTEGYRWNRENVMAALNREMTAPEWKFVQNVWDTIDTLWPEIQRLERAVNGVEPEKVEATPLETSAGTLRGGYYPAIYDTARDHTAEAQAGKARDLLDTVYTRATTRASATKERASRVKRPILLDVGVINRHLGEVIHDITHREAIINADRFLSDKRVMRAVDSTLGPEIRKQFRPWLKHVANQWALERTGNEGLAALVNKVRSNTTIVGMGYRLSTVLTQVAGYSNSFENVGAKWVSTAVVQTARDPIGTFNFVMERSGEIRHRMNTLDRDINAAARAIAGNRDLLSDVKRFAYHGIGYTDRIVVIPTWIGAYNKAIEAGATEDAAIYEADKAVRQSQGSGAAKDLAAIQRGGQLLKLFTMFYSYMSAIYQRNRTLGRDVAEAAKKGRIEDFPGLLARALWLVVVPPVLSELLAGRGPSGDEDWGWWAFKKMIFNALGPIPFVRDVTQPVWNKVEGKPTFGASLSPIQRVYDTAQNVAGDIGRAARGENTQHAIRDSLELTGYATGLVPGQVAAATQFLVDVGYGDQHPETVADWYRGLTTGKAEQKK